MILVLAFEVFLGGLSSPDGLALGPDGTVYVAEEKAGVVTAISPEGEVYTAMNGLSDPEGVAWHPEYELLVVEDVRAGRLISSVAGTLQDSIPNPEGVVVCQSGEIYYTWAQIGGPTGICRWTPQNPDSIITLPVGFMLGGITCGPDNMLYASNETPVIGLVISVIRVNPDTRMWWPYAGGISSAEGLRFAPDGRTLMVAGEDLGKVVAVSPEGETSVFASGLMAIEDILFLPDSSMLVTDDGRGKILRIPWP
jgi:sugar lactone lactonase YvrE